MVPDPLGTLDAVLAGLHTLADISGEVGDEALRNRITGAVTGLRAAILTVRSEVIHQQERCADLESRLQHAQAPAGRRTERAARMKFGCYQFDDAEGLFCASCYDRQGRRIRTIPRAGTMLVCPNCRAEYPFR